MSHQPDSVSMIMLGVNHMDTSIAFYRDAFGLALELQSPEFAFFSAGPIKIVLSAPLARNRQPAAGATEVIFTVPSVLASFELLTSRHVPFAQAPHELYPGTWAANCTDPDGHLLTLFGPA